MTTRIILTFVLLLVVIMPSALGALTDNNIVWLNANEASGSAVNDSSGNGNHFSTNTAQVVQGLISNGRNITSAAVNISRLGQTAYLGVNGSTNQTYAAWVKLTAEATADGQYIFMRRVNASGSTSNSFLCWYDGVTKNVKCQRARDGVGAETVNKSITFGTTWHHVVFRYNLTHIELFVDNVTSGAVASNTTLGTALGAPVFAWGATTNAAEKPLNGTFDMMGFWNRSLSNAEISQLYNNGAGTDIYQNITATLNVTISGSGNVTTTNMSCSSSNCAQTYLNQTSLTLTATPNPNQYFVQWTGACTGSASTCNLTLNDSVITYVNATFSPIPYYNLSVILNGTGGGLVNTTNLSCTSTSCAQVYVNGTQLTITATPDNLSSFDGWSGACTGFGTCTVNMTSNKSLTASFGLLPHTPRTFFNFEENSSNITYDCIGLYTLNHTATYTTGKILNYSLNLAKTQNATYKGPFNAGYGDEAPFTMSFWRNLDSDLSSNQHDYWASYVPSSNYSYHIAYSYTYPQKTIIFQKLAEGVGTQCIVEYTYTIPTNSWNYYTGVFDGTYLKLYINGSLVGTSSACTSNAGVRNRPDGLYLHDTDSKVPAGLNSKVDGFSFDNYAWTPQLVAYEYNNTAGINKCAATSFRVQSNTYSGYRLLNFTANVTTASNTVTSLNTTNGYIDFATSLQNVNITISSSTLTQTYSNVSAASTFTFDYSALVLNVRDYNNANVSNFNYTLNNTYAATSDDGLAVLYINPGTHTVSVTAPNNKYASQTWTLNDGASIKLFSAYNVIKRIQTNTYSGAQAKNFSVNITTAPNVRTQYSTTTGYIDADIENLTAVNFTTNLQGYLQHHTSIPSAGTFTFNYSIVNVTVINALSGSAISSFTTTLYNLTSGNSVTNTTTDGTSLFYVQTGTYGVNATTSGYQSSSDNVTVSTAGVTPKVLSVFQGNSIYLRFIDEKLGTQIPNGIIITSQLVSDAASYSLSTNNGTIIVGLLSPAVYIVRSSALGFSTKYERLTVTNSTFVNRTIYLLNSTYATNVTVKVYTQAQIPVSNAIVNVLKYDLTTNSYYNVETVVTDSDGQAIFSGELFTEYYEFIVQDGSLNTLTTTLPGYLTSTTKIIVIGSSNAGLDSVLKSLGINGVLTFTNSTSNFNLAYSTSADNVENFCLNVYAINTRLPIVNSTCSADGSSSGVLLVGINQTEYSEYNAVATARVDGQTVIVAQLNVVTNKSSGWGYFGIFILMVVTGTIIFAFKDNPSIAIVASTIPMFMTNALGVTIFPIYVPVSLFVISLIVAIGISRWV